MVLRHDFYFHPVRELVRAHTRHRDRWLGPIRPVWKLSHHQAALSWRQRGPEHDDSDGDGFFDLRLFYENGHVVRQEGDTNNDRRVDVWVRFENNERVEQLEDQNFRGKISARYLFKGGQVVCQEQVADGEPPSVTFPFVAVEEEFRNMASYEPSKPADTRAVASKAGTEVK